MGVGVEVRANIKTAEAASKFERAMENLVKDAILYGSAQAKKNAPVKTGHLRRSIHEVKEGRFAGKYGTALVYAPIQEFGGTIRAKKTKVIRPKNAPYLVFQVNGRVVRTKEVRSKNLFFKIGNQWIAKPEVRIRGKYYLKRSADALSKAVPKLARKAVRDVGL